MLPYDPPPQLEILLTRRLRPNHRQGWPGGGGGVGVPSGSMAPAHGSLRAPYIHTSVSLAGGASLGCLAGPLAQDTTSQDGQDSNPATGTRPACCRRQLAGFLVPGCHKKRFTKPCPVRFAFRFTLVNGPQRRLHWTVVEGSK